MKINRNMSAVITNRQLLRTENRLSASMERLSSGFKINKAGDNPAGMAISNKMRAQIDALNQAQSNATDGTSVLQIADGALNEVSSMLQRIRELSVQAANGTNSLEERQSIQDEIVQLRKEVDRISSDTEYNTKPLLDGSSDVRVYSDQATRIDVSDDVLPATYELTVDEMPEHGTFELAVPSGAVSGEITINGLGMEYTAGMPEQDFYESLRQTAELAGCVATRVENNGAITGYTIETAAYGSDESFQLEVSPELAAEFGMTPGTDDVEEDAETGRYTVTRSATDAKITLTQVEKDGFSYSSTYSADGLRVKVTDVNGFSMDFLLNDDPAISDVRMEVTDIGAMTIQIGGNQYQEMDVRIPSTSAANLYLDTVDVTITGGPDKAMVTLDEAISKLSDIRSRIGAFQNRLEHAERSIAETEEDMTAAYSNILDTNMAEEMTEFTQQTVLEQAAISVLSQANELPQQVLSLLQ